MRLWCFNCSLLFVTVCVYCNIHCLVKLCLMSSLPPRYQQNARLMLYRSLLVVAVCVYCDISLLTEKASEMHYHSLLFVTVTKSKECWRHDGITVYLCSYQRTRCLDLDAFFCFVFDWFIGNPPMCVMCTRHDHPFFLYWGSEGGTEGWPGVSSHGDVVERENFSGFSLGRQSPSEGHDVWSHNCRWRTAKGPGVLILGYSKVDQRAFLTC